MASPNRGTRLTKLVSTLKKKFKPTPPAERPLFESLLYACLLENSSHDAAAKALAHLESAYFDWNEVRVSTRSELAEGLKGLNDPKEAADRLKRTLQSVFESVYAFDLEPLKKQNLGQSVKQIAACDGVTPFAVAFVTQNGLGGHAVALNHGALLAFQVLDLISDAEHKKGVVPGLERAVPKSKGVEVGSIVHQLGVEIGRSPYGPAARKLLLELDPKCKDRLPKRPKPAPEPKPEPAKAKKPAAAKAASKQPASKAAAAKKPADAKPAADNAPAPPKKPAAKKAAAKAPATKKAAPKKAATKKKVAKPAKKKAAKKSVAKTAAAKKPAAKKPAAKKKAAKKVAKKASGKKAATAKGRKPR